MSWHSYRSKHTHCLAALILNYSSLPCNPKPPLPGKGQAVPTSKLFLCNLERNIPQVLLFIVFSSSQNSRIYGTRAPNLQRRIKLTLKLRPSGKNKHLTTKIVSFSAKRVCVLPNIPVSNCIAAASTFWELLGSAASKSQRRWRDGGTESMHSSLVG